MTTWGGFSILVCLFMLPPIVVLNRSRLMGWKLWLFGMPAIALGIYLGWFIAILAFGFPEAEWPIFRRGLAAASLLLSPLLTLCVWAAKAHRHEALEEKRREIGRIRDQILADGIVEGPKGPYVRHRPWRAGGGRGTPRRTSGPQGRGPYGMSM